jgi:hypothetical protein
MPFFLFASFIIFSTVINFFGSARNAPNGNGIHIYSSTGPNLKETNLKFRFLLTLDFLKTGYI